MQIGQLIDATDIVQMQQRPEGLRNTIIGLALSSIETHFNPSSGSES